MQKTAYEMRISDWSSDVCSSDLIHIGKSHVLGGEFIVVVIDCSHHLQRDVAVDQVVCRKEIEVGAHRIEAERISEGQVAGRRVHQEIGRASCRERVCQYV